MPASANRDRLLGGSASSRSACAPRVEPSQSAVGVPNITPPWVSHDVVYASEGSAVSVSMAEGLGIRIRVWFRD